MAACRSYSIAPGMLTWQPRMQGYRETCSTLSVTNDWRPAMLSTIAEIIRDLLIFVGVIAALLVALVVVVSKLPDTNPLKRVLTALCYRLGATLAAGAIALPLEPVPGIDLAY